MSETKIPQEIEKARRAMKCLRLEVPEAVAESVEQIVESALSLLTRERDEARERAEAAERDAEAVLAGMAALRDHFLAKIDAGEVAPMPICGWCGEPQKDVESFRSHAVECAKNPSVARALAAESALSASRADAEALRGALREIERIANGRLGWLAGATRDDVHRLLGQIGEASARALSPTPSPAPTAASPSSPAREDAACRGYWNSCRCPGCTLAERHMAEQAAQALGSRASPSPAPACIVCPQCSDPACHYMMHGYCKTFGYESPTKAAPASTSGEGALRRAAQAVVDQYDACRNAGSMSGFWSVLDDLAAQLDGRALAAPRLPEQGEATVACRECAELVNGVCEAAGNDVDDPDARFPRSVCDYFIPAPAPRPSESEATAAGKEK